MRSPSALPSESNTRPFSRVLQKKPIVPSWMSQKPCNVGRIFTQKQRTRAGEVVVMRSMVTVEKGHDDQSPTNWKFQNLETRFRPDIEPGFRQTFSLQPLRRWILSTQDSLRNKPKEFCVADVHAEHSVTSGLLSEAAANKKVPMKLGSL